MRRLAWLCTAGANVLVGTIAGLFGLVRVLQREVTGQAYFVVMHANCHRADLAFKDTLKEAHAPQTNHIQPNYRMSPTSTRLYLCGAKRGAVREKKDKDSKVNQAP